MYSEIQKLNDFIVKNECKCAVLAIEVPKFLPLVLVNFTINSQQCNLYLDDEYKDLSNKNLPLNVEIALRALQDIDTSNDFLSWCNEVEMNPANNQLLEYYKTAVVFCSQIASYFKNNKIESFISDLDFQLNSGAAQYLRKQ